MRRLDKLGEFSQHKCSLAYEPDEIDRLIPGFGLFASIRKKIRRWFLVSPHCPESRRLYKSKAGIENEINRHILFHYYMIHPFSEFRYVWECLMILIYIPALIITPVHLTIMGMAYGRCKSNVDFTMRAVGEITNVFYIIEVFLSFLTGYYKKDTKEVIIDGKIIFKQMIWKIPFYLVALFPVRFFYMIEDFGHDNGADSYALLRSVFIYNLRKYLITCADRNGLTKYYVRILINLITYAYIVHWITCTIIAITFMIQGNQESTVAENSWFRPIEIWRLSHSEIYIHAFSRVVSALNLTGLRHRANVASEDILTVLILYIAGVFQRIIVCSQILALVRNISASKEKYITRLQQLHEFMRFKQLPLRLRRRLIDYFEYRYQNNLYKEQDILNTLTSSLRQEITLYSCRRLVEDVAFFADIPINLLIRIVTRLDSEMFLANDVIVTHGDIGDCMYFIGTGMVAVYNQDGAELAHLGDGSHFGEIALITESSKRVATVIAAQMSEIYILSRHNFLMAMKPYPEIFNRMKQEAFERINSDRRNALIDEFGGSFAESVESEQTVYSF